jgi:hypothetical protein
MGFGSLEPAIACAVELAGSSGLSIAYYTGRMTREALLRATRSDRTDLCASIS